MAQQVVELTSDEAKLLRGMQRIIDQQAKMQAGFKKTGDEAKKAGDEAAKTKPPNEGLAQLKEMAIGWVGITSAIGFATKALREHNEEKRRSLTSVETLDEANRNLAQVSKSEAHNKDLRNKSDALSTQYGLDRVRTRKLLFAAESEGFQDYAADAARFDPVVSMEAQARTAGQVPTLFNNKLTAREGTALALAGSEFSRLDFDPFSQALPQAAQGGQAAGASPEETFALLSVLAAKFRSGDTAADRIKTLGVKLSLDDRFAGGGIVDAVKRMQADSELRKGFAKDSIELNEAINSITQMLPSIDEQTAALSVERAKVGTAEDILERKLRIRQSDPEFLALQRKRKADVQKEIAGEDAYAIGAADTAAAQADVDADLINRGADPLEKLTVRGAMTLAETGDASPMGIKAAGIAGRAFAPRVSLATPSGLSPLSFIDVQGIAQHGAKLGAGEDTFGRVVSQDNLIGSALRLLLAVNEKQLAEMKAQSGNNAAAANAQAGRHIE